MNSSTKPAGDWTTKRAKQQEQLRSCCFLFPYPFSWQSIATHSAGSPSPTFFRPAANAFTLRPEQTMEKPVVVIKIGSSIIADSKGNLDSSVIEKIAGEAAALAQNFRVVLVSSGAV